MIGDIVGGAVHAAFGDGERLQRLENLDAEIEALIEPRAKALEKNADEAVPAHGIAGPDRERARLPPAGR